MVSSRNIKVVDLLVNTENYRFESVSDQKEAIDKMIEDQGDKLTNLAEDIIQWGLNPNDRIQVVLSKHDPTKYNVLEGNRRTVVLKLLNMPDLIDDERHSWLKKKFKKLHESNKSKIIREVECTVYDDPKEAEHWIGVKHGYGESGTGTEEWSPYQKDRFKEKTKGESSVVYQAINLLKNSSEVPGDVKSNLSKISTSNFKRLLDDPEVRKTLGIEISNGIIQSKVNEKEVIKGLTQIARDVLSPKFKVKDIYTKKDREDYIKNFSTSSKPDLSKLATKPWKFNGVDSMKEKRTNQQPTSSSQNRKTLIPSSCTIKINNKPKLEAIYKELKKLDIDKFTNAASFSLRVFVELSIDCYIEEHKLTTSPSSAKSGTDFQQKVFQVADHLKNKGWADETLTKAIKVGVRDQNSLLGIDTLHSYLHNNLFSPAPQGLIHTWNNIQPFMETLWGKIK